jgi:periplasmic protein TonB
VGTLNSQHSLRRTLKPRAGGAPGLTLIIAAVVVGVVVIGGGVGYVIEGGQKHQSAAQTTVGLDAIVPPLASFTSVSPITHVGHAKKPGKHGASPVSQASPGASPTPAPSPSAIPSPSTVNGKPVAAKKPVHHAKSSAASTLAFDPAAATQAAPIDPSATEAPVQPEATAPPTAAATPEPTPIYEPAVVVDARFVSQAQPIYPEIPKSQGIQGTAIVLVTVGPQGNVISQSIGQSTGNKLLDAAALDAARASKFQAPEVDGHPATQTYRIVYTFAL